MQHLLRSLLILSWLGVSGVALANETERPYERCTVAGVVTDHRGYPITQAVVSLFREDEKKVIASVSSDRRGQFFMSRLAPGVYRLLAAARGFQPLLGEPMALMPGQTSQLHLALRPAPDARVSGINPVKYQNRRNRGIFNVVASALGVPASGQPDAWQGTALVSSAGYSTQFEATMAPELTLDFHMRRGWEGGGMAVGGLVRYLTGSHHLHLAVQADTVAATATADPAASENTSPTHLLLRHGIQAGDTWQVTDRLQVLYGFDYVRTEGTQKGDWFPRLAVQWQPGLAWQLHAALTADGQPFPTWTTPEISPWIDVFPTPPAPLALAKGQPAPTRRLRREVGVRWQLSPQTATSALAYQDVFADYPLTQAGRLHAHLGGRNHGVAVVLVHRPLPDVALTTAYAAGQAVAWPQPAGERTQAGAYHVVGLAAEMALHRSGTHVQFGYRRAWGNPLHVIDPFVGHRSLAAPGLSFGMIQALPAWLMPPGQWEAIVEARNLDQRRDEVTGPNAALGFSHRRLLRGGLRFRF
jgi:hypothetical protein